MKPRARARTRPETKAGARRVRRVPNKASARTGEISLKSLIGRQVVLDTAGPITFLGTLLEVRPDGFWLETADLRDKSEGHVTKERYIWEAKEQGIRSNRRKLFVFAHVVISASSLEDVVTEYSAT